ncbi:MAG: 30S ribosome-binding factor RbfA [Micavibrio sp.]
MPRQKTPEPSQRMLRVGEELRHIMSESLRRGAFDDPVLFEAANNVTISQVTVSPDLRYATAYVMTLGGVNLEETLNALNNSAYAFQHDIGKGVKMRSTPRIRFMVDTSYDEAEKINRILNEINKA